MIRRHLTSALVLLLLAACASRPVALVALPAPQRAVPLEDGTGSGATVLLRRVMLPGYLDNYPVVIGRENGVVVVSKDSEWAERLSDAVGRVLNDALSRRLGPSRVLTRGDGRTPDADLTVDFLLLDPQQETLRLDARWTYLCRNRVSRSGRTALQVPLTDATASAVAMATTAALEEIASELAERLDCTPSQS